MNDHHHVGDLTPGKEHLVPILKERGRLGKLQNYSGCFGEERVPCILSGIKARFLDWPIA
jgi:hypothetical protein